ncbi:MAG TPA: hypothetical protein VFM15_05055 [Gammaproteobacteria bacterium]|nr:hypothetical protein [Gammaproteobacteria bacterium]
MLDAEQPECESKLARSENAFIVGSEPTRLAEPLDGIEHCAEDSNAGLVPQGRERQVGSRAMIHQAENGMQPSLIIGFARQIESPDAIRRARRQFPVPHLASGDPDLIRMTA